jgi:hypothetical protein
MAAEKAISSKSETSSLILIDESIAAPEPACQVEWVEPQYVPAFWEKITPGIWASVRKSGGNEKTVERIRESLGSGAWSLWLVASGDGLEGFAITEPLLDDHGWWLNVPFAWSRGRVDTHGPFFEHVTPLAKKSGALGVKFISSRLGYKRMAEKKGWHVRMREFIVEEF